MIQSANAIYTAPDSQLSVFAYNTVVPVCLRVLLLKQIFLSDSRAAPAVYSFIKVDLSFGCKASSTFLPELRICFCKFSDS